MPTSSTVRTAVVAMAVPGRAETVQPAVRDAAGDRSATQARYGFHHARLSRYHATVLASPLSNPTRGRYPSSAVIFA